MTSSLQNWLDAGRDYGWTMPPAPKWKRLPVIRHMRAIHFAIQVERHERFYNRLGLIATGQDRWIVWGIMHGMEVDS